MKNLFTLDGNYLAGLYEANGCILIPKTGKKYARIKITFHEKNYPLAKEIKNFLNVGNVNKMKNEKACKWEVSDKIGILKIIDLLNGKLRTPKIKKFNELIILMNEKYNKDKDYKEIKLLPLNNSPLKENSWFSGFCDGDSCFIIDILKNIYVSCVFTIDQRLLDISGESCEIFMKEIAQLLNVNLRTTKRKVFTLKASNIESRNIIIDYLTKLPLKGNKFLDYMDWLKVHNMKEKATIKGTKLDIETIRKIKNQMNNQRSYEKSWETKD